MIDISNIVDEVIKWFKNSPYEERDRFLNTNRNDLFKYHHSLGTKIRDHFKLWDSKWEEEIIGLYDISPEHPDSISMLIIESVYDKLKKQEDDYNKLTIGTFVNKTNATERSKVLKPMPYYKKRVKE